MKQRALAAIFLAATTIGCQTGDVTSTGGCSSGRCGFIDHHYNATFYCPPAPLVPGGWFGYSYRDASHCHQECASAGSWGCDASGCDASCDADTGSGAWLTCDATNNARQTAGGCFLQGSGVTGETVPCVCR